MSRPLRTSWGEREDGHLLIAFVHSHVSGFLSWGQPSPRQQGRVTRYSVTRTEFRHIRPFSAVMSGSRP